MLLIALVLAALGAEPAWTLDLDAPGAHLVHAGDGRAVAWVPGEVLGIDLALGTVDWRREVPEASRGDLFQPVPHTPFVLLSIVVPGPDAFELIDARTGVTAWRGEEGEVALGAWAAADHATVLVLTDTLATPGALAVAVGPPGATRRSARALHAPPPIVPARPGPTAIYSARGAPLPVFVDGDVITAWSPLDGVARRGGDGAVRWRVLLPGAEEVTPLRGFPDPRLGPEGLVVPVRARRVTTLDLATGLPRWRDGRGRLRRPVRHLAVGGAWVAVADDDRVALLHAGDGRRAWARRVASPVAAIGLSEAHVVALDDGGWLSAYDSSRGALAWRARVVDDALSVPLGLVRVEDGWAVTLEQGAVGVTDDGEVRWRRAAASQRGSSDDTLGLAARGAREARWRAALDREAPPPGHPASSERVWVVPERIDGRIQAVLHRVDLATGAHASLPLGSEHARWLWDPATGIALRLDAGGYLVAFELR